MPEPGLIAVEIPDLRPGDYVVVAPYRDAILYRGRVDEVAPRFDVIWVRDALLGERKMFFGVENRLYGPVMAPGGRMWA